MQSLSGAFCPALLSKYSLSSQQTHPVYLSMGLCPNIKCTAQMCTLSKQIKADHQVPAAAQLLAGDGHLVV